MNKKDWLILIALSAIPFILYFFSGTFIDGDSYYYLRGVCFGEYTGGSDLLFSYLIPFIPCNFFVIKTLQWISYLLCLVILTKITQIYSPKYYQLTPFLVSSTFLVTEFMKFENDIIGIIFGLIGIYLLLNKHPIKALIIMLIGFGFWYAIGYWIITIPIMYTFYLFTFIFLIPFFNKIFWFIGTKGEILEQMGWLGFLNYGFTLPLFYIGFFKSNKKIFIIFFLLILINIFVSKLWVLALPFGLIIALSSLEIKNNEVILKYIKISGIVMTFFFMQFIPTQPFTQQDISLIQEGVNLACLENNCEIQNDFSSGWVIKYYDGKTEQYAGTTPYEYKGIVIDINFNDLPKHCEKIDSTKYFSLLRCKQ